MLDSSILKPIFAVKTLVIVLLGAWLLKTHLKIGEQVSVAQDNAPAPTASQQAQTGDTTETLSDDETAAAGEGGGMGEKNPAETPKKKSLLAQLLDLPEIRPDKVEKAEVGRYLRLVDQKKKQIDTRIRQLKRKEEQLTRLENDVQTSIKKLEQERTFFAQTLQREKDLKGERLDRLVKLYEKMEPKKAAPVFEELDRDLVIALFEKLRQKQVTAILENMNPERSVALSEYFGRVRSTREYEILKEMNTSLKQAFDACKTPPAT